MFFVKVGPDLKLAYAPERFVPGVLSGPRILEVGAEVPFAEDGIDRGVGLCTGSGAVGEGLSGGDGLGATQSGIDRGVGLCTGSGAVGEVLIGEDGLDATQPGIGRRSGEMCSGNVYVSTPVRGSLGPLGSVPVPSCDFSEVDPAVASRPEFSRRFGLTDAGLETLSSVWESEQVSEPESQPSTAVESAVVGSEQEAPQSTAVGGDLAVGHVTGSRRDRQVTIYILMYIMAMLTLFCFC